MFRKAVQVDLPWVTFIAPWDGALQGPVLSRYSQWLTAPARKWTVGLSDVVPFGANSPAVAA